MAEKLISPGFFTEEKDVSFLPVGIGAIGAAIVGPTLKGPAFVPTIINSFEEFQQRFGVLDASTYVPYAVKEYLRSAGTVTILRVMTSDPWQYLNTAATGYAYVVNILSASVTHSIGYLIPKQGFTGSADLVAISNTGGNVDANNFTLSSSAFGTVSSSVLSSATNNLMNVFGDSITATTPNILGSRYYLYRYWDITANSLANFTASIAATPLQFSARAAFNNGTTPVITSQLVNGVSYDLFQVARRSDGILSNYDAKIVIEDVKKAGTIPGSDYGSFNLFVRRVGSMLDSADTDQRQQVLESWVNLSLDPTSLNFISKRIGDQYETVDADGRVTVTGDFVNKSKYIYIIPNVSLETYPVNLVPFGFDPVKSPISSSTVPVIAYVSRQGTALNYDKRVAFGFDFYNADARQYLWSNDDSGIDRSIGVEFNLDNMFSHVSASGVKATDGTTFTAGASLSSSIAPTQMLKFAVPFQGGHDGMAYNRAKSVGANISAGNVFGFDCTTATSSGSLAYVQALNVLKNADEYDINMLLVPGIISSVHSTVTEKAIEIVTDRGDAFYIMDTIQLTDNITTAINNVSALDTNYTATYYPWVKIVDAESKKEVWVTPSTVMGGVVATNDKLSYEWFAPAGLNRGGIPNATKTYLKLSQEDRDDLYINRINPIATFPNTGIVAWGQKTLQSKPSALDRINVRRLLINLKKYIASSTRYLVFEQNTVQTREAFKNIVNPYMEQVKQRQGLYVFKVVMDDSNNTPDVIDRNILYGQIYLQPTKTAEFILIDFNITPTGAEFG